MIAFIRRFFSRTGFIPGDTVRETQDLRDRCNAHTGCKAERMAGEVLPSLSDFGHLVLVKWSNGSASCVLPENIERLK